MRTLFGLVPSVLILALLIVTAYVGHKTQWKVSNLARFWKPEAEEAEKPKEADEPKKNEPPEAKRVRFASAEALKQNGIATAAVEQRAISEVLTANGILEYNRTRLAHLAPRSPGHVWRVYKRVGDPVRKGDVLGLVDAADVGRAKAEFLEALRLQQLNTESLAKIKAVYQSSTLVPDRQLREAESAAASARIRLFTAEQALVNLGLPVHADQVVNLPDDQLTRRLQFLALPESITRTLDPATTTANLIPLVASFDGVVTRSEVIEGEMVTTAQPLFVIADLHRLWAALDVRPEDIGRVRKGQRVAFQPEGMAGVEVGGTVTWISTEVDDKTRLIRVRAEVDNPDGQLRANSFGTGRIRVGERPDAVAVPADAVQWNGTAALVFVRQSDGLSFEARPVKCGTREQDFVEILEGLHPGEVVATVGSHALKSELFKTEEGGEK